MLKYPDYHESYYKMYVLSFLHADCVQEFGNGQSMPCFAVLMPEMQQQLKSSKVSVPQNLAALMVSTHPTQVMNGVKREFLKPESTLHFIP